jgi:acetyltransferase-like isoleucine patch superfamily enzyme
MAQLRDYRKFLSAGYTLPELAMNFFRLMVYSRLTSALKHSFARRGTGVVIDYTSCIQGSNFMVIDDDSWLQRYVWLTCPLIEMKEPPKAPVLRIGKRVQLGPRSFISAVNDIQIDDDVLFAPNVYISDHIHAYEAPGVPIKDQGLSPYGRVRVGRGAWLGINTVIAAAGKDIEIGEGSVISANSVVTRSVPARCVAAGNPARVIKRWDEASGRWVPVIPKRSR